MSLDQNLKLSQNFTLKEVSRSQMALRYGIDNRIPGMLVPRARLLAQKILQPVRDHFKIPFSPNSWYRCQELERVICKRGYRSFCRHRELDPDMNSSWAQYLRRKSHPKAEAADIEIPGVSNHELFYWIKDHLQFDQLLLEFGSKDDPHAGWVHVSFSEEHNRNEVREIK